MLRTVTTVIDWVLVPNWPSLSVAVKLTGAKPTRVAYRGTGPALNDLVVPARMDQALQRARDEHHVHRPFARVLVLPDLDRHPKALLVQVVDQVVGVIRRAAHGHHRRGPARASARAAPGATSGSRALSRAAGTTSAAPNATSLR